MTQTRIVIPYVPDRLRPQVKGVGQQVGAEFREMVGWWSYWEMFDELWLGERDFVNWEEDVVASVELIESLRRCQQPFCAATFGRWNILDGGQIESDVSLGLVRFGSIRRAVPDAMARAKERWPDRWPRRSYQDLCCGLLAGVLRDEEHVSAHLHFPVALHLNPNQFQYPDPWDEARFQRDIAEPARRRAIAGGA